jgi:hypothetical protein
MPANYTYSYDSTNKLYKIETNASNILIGGLTQSLKLSTAGEYGINGGFFDLDKPPLANTLYLAMSNGNTIYAGTDRSGYTNHMGFAAICCSKAGALKWYSAGVTNITKIDSSYQYWAQGGPSLRLGQNGDSGLEDEMADQYATYAPRSAIVAKISTKKVYLIAATDSIQTATFRTRIAASLGFSNTGSSPSTEWVGIVLDGGASSALRCAEKNIEPGRKLSQVILLRDRT